MLKKIILSIVLILANINYAASLKSSAEANQKIGYNVYKMPSEKVLVERLQEEGFTDYFIELTEIHKKFADQEQSVLTILREIELLLCHYHMFMSYGDMLTDCCDEFYRIIQQEKTKLISILLQDFPKAIEEIDKSIKTNLYYT